MDPEKTGPGRGNHNLGNETGHATRFEKGKSGNPGGRPSRTPFLDAYRALAELRVKDLEILPTDTIPVANAKRLAKLAQDGNVAAAAEIANRAEGTPPRRVEIQPEREVRIGVVFDDDSEPLSEHEPSVDDVPRSGEKENRS